jgi:uncharacterized protein involved in tolerance to divalent cations
LPKKETTDFELLKKKIVAVMQQSYPGISASISEWKGQDIVNFQEELLLKVNAHISEKWFYTHMKADSGKLPRIDVLNLLSKYVGYADWNDFVYKNSGGQPGPFVSSGNRYFIIVPLMVLCVLGIFLLINKLISTREYTFCFYDTNTKDPITSFNTNNSINNNGLIEVSVIMENESPMNYLCGPDGCFTLKTDRSIIKMVVTSPYYRNDTITRILKKFNQHEMIGLQANDYALMLKYFSEMNVQDWQKRRQKLDEMFDEGAMIYQVMDDKRGTGMELYSKWEFIDKLTMPSQSLRNIEILNTKYVGDRIAVLRFRTSDSQP